MFRLSNKFGRDPKNITFFSLANAAKKIPSLGEKIFVNSMSDTFHEKISFEIITSWMNLFRKFPNHQFQVLTKRINRARQFVFETRDLPDNVWLGTSVEDRWHTFRIKTLQQIPHTGIKFVSFEPLLGHIGQVDLDGIDWAIVGGESGINSRPMDPAWANWIRHLCSEQNVAFFFKQMGGKEDRDGAGGDLLYGKQYKEFPCLTNYSD